MNIIELISASLEEADIGFMRNANGHFWIQSENDFYTMIDVDVDQATLNIFGCVRSATWSNYRFLANLHERDSLEKVVEWIQTELENEEISD